MGRHPGGGASARRIRQRPDTTAGTRTILAAIDRVAHELGNTRAVCRKCYIHPAVLDAYLAGLTIGRIMASVKTPPEDSTRSRRVSWRCCGIKPTTANSSRARPVAARESRRSGPHVRRLTLARRARLLLEDLRRELLARGLPSGTFAPFFSRLAQTDRPRSGWIISGMAAMSLLAFSAVPLRAQTPADNTKVNTRDRANDAITADQQKDNSTDRLLSQKNQTVPDARQDPVVLRPPT